MPKQLYSHHCFMLYTKGRVAKKYYSMADVCTGKIYLMQKRLRCNKGMAKHHSYLEVNAGTDWQQQDLISECMRSMLSILNT